MTTQAELRQLFVAAADLLPAFGSQVGRLVGESYLPGLAAWNVPTF